MRKVDACCFTQAQKKIWVKLLLDDNYSSTWKSIEVAALQKFHPDIKILRKSYAPDKILTQLQNTQLADSLKSWYIFRDKVTQEGLGIELNETRCHSCIWFDRNVRTKSKSYFYYEAWYKKGIYSMTDLMYDDI